MTSTPSAAHQQSMADEVDPRGAGLVDFAAILIATFGIFNVLNGIAAIVRSHAYVRNANYVFGDLRAWGWVVLAFGILQLVAVGSLAQGRPWARWFAIVVLAVNALIHMVFLPSYPIWSVLVVAADVVALYALTAYGTSWVAGTTQTGPEIQRGVRPPV